VDRATCRAASCRPRARDDQWAARRLDKPDLAVIDPETAERITRFDGAERWARLQPFAYRSGDLNVEVTEVSEVETPSAAFHYFSTA
jgi:hypothetical protein